VRIARNVSEIGAPGEIRTPDPQIRWSGAFSAKLESTVRVAQPDGEARNNRTLPVQLPTSGIEFNPEDARQTGIKDFRAWARAW
jgi:hypothetical protein